MIKLKYEAIDGKIFDTEEECRKYNNIPRIYLVSEHGFGANVIRKAFVSQEVAKHYMELNNDESDYTYLSLDTVEIDTNETVTNIHSRILNDKEPKKDWIKSLKGLILDD